MPIRSSKELSLSDLEELLLSRRQQLSVLLERRGELHRELKEIESQIAQLQGSEFDPNRSAPIDRRSINKQSLRQHVLDVLRKSNDGCDIHRLATEVLAAGYITESKNFRNVLYQCLYNAREVFHDAKTGTYRIRTDL